MEIKEQHLIELVNSAKEEIEEVKRSCVEDKKSIDEINNLVNKLKEIKTALAPKQRALDKRIENLNLILEEILNVKSDLILSRECEMFEVIDKNLLDGMSLGLVKDKENKKVIKFNEEDVGSIEVLEGCRPNIRIRVTIYNNIDEFLIENTLKMYSIISFINTKFNYKQE